MRAAPHRRVDQIEQRRGASAQLAVERERARLAVRLDAAACARVRSIIMLAEQDAGAFGEIEQLARASLEDMRDLLGVLRSEGTLT